MYENRLFADAARCPRQLYMKKELLAEIISKFDLSQHELPA